MAVLPYVPEYITVHLGTPDSDAENFTLTFPEYIKNVASSEIYPTWPEAALRANILAQISFALNRVYTEFYRSQGYDFDITNSTATDQAFVKGRIIFENISQIVDEIFNDYVRKVNTVEPYFTQYCNGTTSLCEGLSQWGTVDLANQGLGAYDILTYYYGNDLEIVTDAPVRGLEESYIGAPLREGTANSEVRFIQLRLNRISSNYPAIPKIYPTDGRFGPETAAAVREFQKIFDLEQTGVVDKSTWYRIQFIYNAVKKTSDLESEGIQIEDVKKQFPDELSLGDTGDNVRSLQYFLALVGYYNEEIPQIEITGTFDANTESAVKAFQRLYGLEPTGIADFDTWYDLWGAYNGIVESLIGNLPPTVAAPYPGTFLRVGSQGDDVALLQEYINVLSGVYPSIPPLEVDGVFGVNTRDAVYAVQDTFGLPINGTVGPLTWDKIAQEYENIVNGNQKSGEQYGGTVLREEQ